MKHFLRGRRLLSRERDEERETERQRERERESCEGKVDKYAKRELRGVAGGWAGTGTIDAYSLERERERWSITIFINE